MDYKAHWSHVYQTKSPTQVSWYQAHPAVSLRLIVETGIAPGDPIIDVGAGASTLADHLIERGYTNVTLLDVSGEALQATRARLGAAADAITWIEDDVTTVSLPAYHYAVWHDRAVFHFLTDEAARRRYVAQVARAVRSGGYVIVGTFALDGPDKCSGLDVVRYSPTSVHAAFGRAFELVHSENETHQTPWGSEQRFVYCCCKTRVEETAPAV